jgi:Fur family ferric uptake transcriptional regulator
MCDQCDYVGFLSDSGLGQTAHRLRVLEIIGASRHPLSAQEIIETMNTTQEINRVTVYRILDLLVDKRLVERISSGDRSFRYGLAPNVNHEAHAHFYCIECKEMACLSPDHVDLSMESLERSFAGLIERVEVRLDGICQDCRR